MEDALYAHTVGAAFSVHEEGMKGSILPGFLADFVFFDRNFLELPKEKVFETKVTKTFLGGKEVFCCRSPLPFSFPEGVTYPRLFDLLNKRRGEREGSET